MESKKIMELVKRIQAISHLGLVYASNEYEMERYHQLQDISNELLHQLTNEPIESIQGYFTDLKEYITPKVDIRAVVFNDKNEILLVKEKADGRWSLPGGWADIGFTPAEIAVSEVKEETGLDVKAGKLLAVLDKRCYPHPPEASYVYKFFIQCHLTGGDFTSAFDILDKGFFPKDAIPPLSLNRVLPEQIALMFEYVDNPHKETFID